MNHCKEVAASRASSSAAPMSEYEVWIEYGYHGTFCLKVNARSMEDAVRIAMAEGVPASFAREKMTRLSVSLERDADLIGGWSEDE